MTIGHGRGHATAGTTMRDIVLTITQSRNLNALAALLRHCNMLDDCRGRNTLLNAFDHEGIEMSRQGQLSRVNMNNGKG